MQKVQTPKTADAPVAATTEASMKFLDPIFKDSTMETIAIPADCQLKLLNESIDMATISLGYGEGIHAVLSAIARLSTDNTITDLAIHAKHQADMMNNDLDVFR